MEDLKKIQEFFSNPLKEENQPKFKKGDKVTYLGHPGEITGFNKEMTGVITYNVAYDKGNGRTKASNIDLKSGAIKPVNEMDINDPALVKYRAMKSDREKLAKMRAANAGGDGNDAIFRKARANAKKLEALKQKRAQIMRDMEQEAEIEGGPIADKYGSMLNKIDKAIDLLSPQNKGDEYMSKDEIERRAAMISDPYADYTSKTNAMFGLEENKEEDVLGDWIADMLKYKSYDEVKKIVDRTLRDALESDEAAIELQRKKERQNANVFVREASKKEETEFHTKLDKLVHKTFGKRKDELEETKELTEEGLKDSITKALSDKGVQFQLATGLGALAVGLARHPEMIEKILQMVGLNEAQEELTEAYVPQNIKEFAKRKGVSRLVNTVAGWAEKVGARITGGTAIGKYYDTLILDMGYQTSDIRINCEDETVELYYEPVNSFADFKRVFMEEESRKQAEHDEETLRREQGLEETIKFIKENNPKVTKEEVIAELKEIKKLGTQLNEELCEKGKRYIAARQAAGEKSSAYLSGRGVKVCNGSIEWPKKGKKKK